MRTSPYAVFGFAATLFTSGCGQGDTSSVSNEAGAEAASEGGLTDVQADQTLEADVEREVGTDSTADRPIDSPPDGSIDSPSDRDIGLCTQDSATLVCCCDGDLGGIVVCNPDGGLSCSGGSFPSNTFGLYYGADCSRACGPCTLPCFDSGPSSESGVDGGDAASD